MSEEKYYALKNISEKQLHIIYDALDRYVSAGTLQFENCILPDFIYGKFSKTTVMTDIHTKCEELRHCISKENPKYKDYHKNARWNLGIFNDDTPHDAKVAFDIYRTLKNNIYNKHLPKIIEEIDDISLENFNPRKEKIKKILNKK